MWKDRKNKITLSAMVAGLAILTYFGLDISEGRPALLFELNEVKAEFYSDKCDRLKKEWYVAKDLAETYVREEKATPQWLYDKIVQLEREMERLCNKE